MTSIYQQILGTEFDNLHPKIQQRFGFSSEDGVAAIGTGVMKRISHGPLYTLPFLYVGAWRRIMFPERGTDVPFTIRNYAYLDNFGRETVTWIRTFQTRKTRRFDATMINSQTRGLIIDYLGTHQHLAVDLHLSVDEETKGLRLRSGEQRVYEGILGFRFPMLFSGDANVCEWYDDQIQKYRISMMVSNPIWGFLFGYEGSFEVEWKTVSAGEDISDVKPLREERRE